MQMEEIKVSVIVPVYNAEAHLNQCLDSILAQTLKEIEIICVDDGSTDSSPAILEEYAQRDPRLCVLHQQNLYAGTARNTGKAQAVGKYLAFWDADDYFLPDALRLMYEQCEKDRADICICGARQFYEDLGFDIVGPNYLRKRDLPKKVPFNMDTHPDHILNLTVEAAWNKLFRRAFVVENNLDFQGIRNANDVYFVENSLCLAQTITLVNEPLVVYRKNQAVSLVSTLSKSPVNALKAWTDTAENLKKLDRFPERSFANRALESVIHLLHNMRDWEAFKNGVEFLQGGVLEQLSIHKQEDPSYYFNESYEEIVEHLYDDTPEEFLAFFHFFVYERHLRSVAGRRRDNSKNKERIKELEKKIANDHFRWEESINENDLIKNKLLQLKVVNKDLAAMHKQLTAENEKLWTHIDEQEKQKKSLENQIARLEAERKKLNQEKEKLKQEKEKLKQEKEAIRSSKTFRIGRIILYIPRKIAGLFRRK